MKIKGLILIMAFIGGMDAKAQLSIAADVAFPMGDFGETYSLGVGPSLGYDLALGDRFTVFGQAGYSFLMTKSDLSDVISGAYMIPYQAGLKVNIGKDTNGLYGMAMLGGHTIGAKVTILGVETDSNSSLFSWGLGAGIRMGSLDIGARYNSISPDKDVVTSSASNYFALRLGFILGVK